MIDGSILQSAQRCFEKKSRVVVKMVVSNIFEDSFPKVFFSQVIRNFDFLSLSANSRYLQSEPLKYFNILYIVISVEGHRLLAISLLIATIPK